MSNSLLYNKYRPKVFEDVGGNEPIRDLLKNLVRNKAYKNTHFIFHGNSGTGKTTLARILARAINCDHLIDGEPCNQCENCKAHLAGQYPDYIEVDGAAYNKVEDAIRLVELANQHPINSNHQRVILIDEAHVLSNQAFDKFLILLESANVKTTFIFTTTDIHLFRPAIISRCFTFEVRPMRAKDIAKEIIKICESEKLEYEVSAINKLAYHYACKPREAIKVLDLHVRARGDFKTFSETTREAQILSAYKLAYFNKIPEALNITETLDEHNFLQAIVQCLNEVYLYPQIPPSLLQAEQIEEFKTIVEPSLLKTWIRDIMLYKPSSVEMFNLILAQVSESGLKTSKTIEDSGKTMGRRFAQDTQKVGKDMLRAFGFKELG